MGADDNKSTKSLSPSEQRKGSYLLAQEKAKEDRKIKIWHSRVAYIKKGHSYMQNRLYSEAAVVYEKYLKILEIVFECGPGALTPEMFKDQAKTAELSVITGVYWDLLRIYDTNSAYLERQKKVALQLAKFAVVTPIFPDLLKKANVFLKQCRHPDVVKSFLTAAGSKRPRCFIATSAFESPLAVEVQILRHYRDSELKNSVLGRHFILYYYKYSPYVACVVDKHSYLKAPIRSVLRYVIKRVS